ncbi:radical SAM protein [bacterium]|nr:MAG: radical SAM protein [bacterium]
MEPREIRERGEELWERLESCDICPNECRVNRLKGEVGRCGVDAGLIVSSFHLHFGEEPPISGFSGSGTIFFSGCPSKCVYCQNYSISWLKEGYEVSIPELARMMLLLEERGAHNINLVTPTHYLPHILLALAQAREKGLKIPLVYNTFGYEKVEIIKKLEGVVDIYMPDMRYASDEAGKRYSGVKEYAKRNREAVYEMWRQTGPWREEAGIGKKGVLVRLLILPQGISGTEDTLEFIKDKLKGKVYVSLMSQYHPVFRARNFPELSRPITREEYERARKKFQELGLYGYVQPFIGRWI